MSDFKAPPPASEPVAANGNANGSLASGLQSTKDSAIATAQSTYQSVAQSQPVQELKNGPIAQNVSNEASKTTGEFKDLYNSRTTPSAPAATGQPLTHYHSFFYRLLSWQNPRATGLTFAANILFIFAARYLNVLSYGFKLAYFVLGITASLEIAGKLLFDNGLATKMRPRQYWTIPRDSLERSLDDAEQLVNFFVIETQRVLFAENVYVTIASFVAALVSYWLIKLVPFWGLSLIATSTLYLGPLVYIQNKQAIDDALANLNKTVSSQAVQFKQLTAEQTGKASQQIRAYAGEASSKAQGYLGSKKPASGSVRTSPSDFPAPPQTEPAPLGTTTTGATTTGAQPIAA